LLPTDLVIPAKAGIQVAGFAQGLTRRWWAAPARAGGLRRAKSGVLALLAGASATCTVSLRGLHGRTYMDASRVASGFWKFWLGGFIADLYPACALADRSLRLAL